MAAGFWKRFLVLVGLVEQEEDLSPISELPDAPQIESVRTIPPVQDSSVRPIASHGGLEPGGAFTPQSANVALAQIAVLDPSSFKDAKEVGDKLKRGTPVLMNLQVTPAEAARSLLDFASGATYVLGGTMQKVGDRVFLLTPPGVAVSVEETEKLMGERGFFGQL